MFKVNDCVKVKNYNRLPTKVKHRGLGKVCGKVGYVSDVVLSEKTGEHYYIVKLNGSSGPSTIKFTDEMLTFAPKRNDYFVKVFCDMDAVIAKLYDKDGNLISEGHGHIFKGNSADRVAQAVSIACKRLYAELDHEFAKKIGYTPIKSVS